MYKTIGGLALSTAILTEIVMRLTPKNMDKKRFALPISVFFGLLLSMILYACQNNLTVYDAIMRGLIIGASASGSFDAIKTTQAHIKGGSEKHE